METIQVMDTRRTSGARRIHEVHYYLPSSLLRNFILLALTLTVSLTAYPSASCVKEVAYSQIGVKEEGGNNKGKQVETYLKNAGINHPAAWCGAFVKWVLDQCHIDHWVTAWSPSGTSRNRIYDRKKPNDNKVTPEQMDIFTLYYPSLKRIGHVGFIDEWGDKWVTTIEGNTNDSGSRESFSGDMVMKRKRLKSTIYQVSRPNYNACK